jgi:hypothetical protein
MKIGELVRRAARFWCRDRAARELEQEMGLHVELCVRRLREEGISAEEAKYEALRDSVIGVRGRRPVPQFWGWHIWEGLVQDLRHTVRGLCKAPGFTLIAMATLAVGLGMNTAVFSVVDAVMLRRLPYSNPNQLVSL